jgi:hypothetical protein
MPFSANAQATAQLAEQGDRMGTVVIHNVVSVDGYIADEADDVLPGGRQRGLSAP